MKQQILLIIIVFAVNPNIFSQHSSFRELVTLKKLELGTHGFGFSYATAKSRRTTLDLAVGLGGGHRIGWRNFQYAWSLGNPAVYIKAHSKFYYNRDKRLRNNQLTRHNTGPYLGCLLTYTSANITKQDYVRPAGQVSIHWGYQRILAERIIANFHIGLAITEDFESGYGMLSPSLNIRFYYLLERVKD